MTVTTAMHISKDTGAWILWILANLTTFIGVLGCITLALMVIQTMENNL